VPVAQVIRVGLPAGERLQPKLQNNMNAFKITVFWHVVTYASVSVDENTRHYSSQERSLNKRHPENLGFTTFLSHDTACTQMLNTLILMKISTNTMPLKGHSILMFSI